MMYISSCPWRNIVANSLTEIYSSPCLSLTYRSPYAENCRRKQFTDAVHTVASMMIIGGKPTHGNVQIVFCPWSKLVANQIALSTFDEDCRRTYSYCRSAPTDSRFENWCSKRRFPEVNRSPFRNCEEREKNPSLCSSASQLVVSDVAASLLARSFAKKNFKRNLWHKDSGETFRRWFEIHRTGGPYRWTRS